MISKFVSRTAVRQLRQSTSLLRRGLSRAFATTTDLPSNIKIDEENIPSYNAKEFFPMHPGVVLNERYKGITKLGWGASSTVWLARDKQESHLPNSYVALKIHKASGKHAYDDVFEHETSINKRLSTNFGHRGSLSVQKAVDSFEAKGPDGTRHFCQVYEPMRELLSAMQARFNDGGKIPFHPLKLYVMLMLRGLEYLHSECHIIHSDLKPDNILLGFERDTVLQNFVDFQTKHPMPRKYKDGRTIYRSQDDFGEYHLAVPLPQISDFGVSQVRHGFEVMRNPIQPSCYVAPEVLFGTGWSYSANIWNLGVMIWDLLEGKYLFQNRHDGQGVSSAKYHITEMIALLGPPPGVLIEKERHWREVKLDRSIINRAGQRCETPCQFFGGPFDSKGDFMFKDLIPLNVSLENSVTSIGGREKQLFLQFARKML